MCADELGEKRERLNKPTNMFSLSSNSALRFGDALQGGGWLASKIARPHSPRTLAWDFSSCVFMFFDLCIIPMQAFDLPHSIVLDVMGWLTTIFWSCDVPMSFLAGYHDGGVIELRPRVIARRYLRGWCALDITIVMVDWTSVFMGDASAGVAGVVRLGKISRIMHLLRVLRLFKMLKVFAGISPDSYFTMFVRSEYFETIGRCSKWVVCILIMSHFIACGWYFVGSSDFYAGARGKWVSKFAEDQGYEPSIFYAYSTALHWTLTQFTPASMEVVPRNAIERVYAIIVLTCAVMTFSSFLSSITSAMTQLRMINIERSKQASYIQQYITEKRVSLELGNRIYHYLRRNASTKKVHECDVGALSLLSKTLLVDLHWEVYMPHIVPHPFFHHLSEADMDAFVNICHSAMSEKSILAGQALFLRRDVATEMYVVASGELEYFFGDSSSNPAGVQPGSHYVCEAVLWVQWEHRGRLNAAKHCEVVALNGARFRTISAACLVVQSCRDYAHKFVQCGPADENEDIVQVLTDLGWTFDRSQEMAQEAFKGSVDMEDSWAVQKLLKQRQVSFMSVVGSANARAILKSNIERRRLQERRADRWQRQDKALGAAGCEAPES